ncbi:MAG TPA: hypothetical protein VM187_15195, partial [Niastella sp.]|nr:hypothetical protein [Niastella sp.]
NKTFRMNCRQAILQHTLWISLLLMAGVAGAQQGGAPSQGELTLAKGESVRRLAERPTLTKADPTPATQATWIWYPGDFEIWLANKMQNRRTERGSFFPPFWKLDGHYVLMDFHKDVELTGPEQIDVFVEGNYILKLD